MNDCLKERLRRLRHEAGTTQPGFSATRLPGAQVFWSDHPIPRVPLYYDPGIAVIVSGRKTGFLNGATFVYGAGSYLAVGLPVCFDCETEATPDEPMVGIFLHAEQAMLRELAAGLAETDSASCATPVTLGVEPLPLSPAMLDAVSRLATQLCDHAQAQLLAPATLREVFFHALQDRHGRVLMAQTRPDRPEARIAALLRRLDRDPCRDRNVEQMAAETGMSPATFYRRFREAFGVSPLQYLKRRRLLRARSLLSDQGASVAEAAHATGYTSAAHFSRDFRATFGRPPSAEHRATGS